MSDEISWQFELSAKKRGFKNIVGVDEAGRGPLAGPVVACACLVSPLIDTSGIDDSKKLSPKQRQEIFSRLTADKRVQFSYAVIGREVIDEINIYQATIMAMKKALSEMPAPFDYVLVDGMTLPLESIPTEKIVGGDRRSYSIACASILAKVLRDNIMEKEIDPLYPEYGFSRHKGYGTAFHLEAIKKYGVTDVHRRSFSPIKEMVC